jgi:hypothetical protein
VVVEHIGVVGVDQMVFVRRRAVEATRHVFPREDLDHARHRHRLLAVDLQDARMRVRRAQHLEVKEILDCDVHRVTRMTGDDPRR